MRGFNALGETGAGKTFNSGFFQYIIAGGRFSKEMIKKKEKLSFCRNLLYFYQIQKNKNYIVSKRGFILIGK